LALSGHRCRALRMSALGDNADIPRPQSNVC
jgi:hypothetical protein